jgi:glycolate oxidase FAD binding subunit
MSEVLRPAVEWELQTILNDCATRGRPIEVIGAGTKRSVGRPVEAEVCVSTSSFRGIPLYEPTELVMSARTGTQLSQIEVELAARGQMLPFEPVDISAAIGSTGAGQTIGSVFAGNLSGARRVSAGSARDHLIGVRGINGRAEAFKSGGRVMKNVTGYDIARALTGSWGTLAILTEVTFKVVPSPETAQTLVLPGLTEDVAIEALCTAVGTPYEVSGAAHLSAALAARLGDEELASLGKSLTLIRVENFTRSVTYRLGRLKEDLKAFGKSFELDDRASMSLWSGLRKLSVFPFGPTQLWRISATPTKAPQLVAAIRRHMPAEAYYDWAGGLVWLEVPAMTDAGAADVRRATALHGGYATLIRAAPEVRAHVDVFQPMPPAIEKISRGLKAAFDPAGILNPGRMYAGV